MAILDEKKQKDILKSWEKWRGWRDDGKPIKGVPRFFPPITEKIDAMPIAKGEDFRCPSPECRHSLGSISLNRDLNMKLKCPICKEEQIYRGKRTPEKKEYQKKIEQKIKNYEKIQGMCYLYVTFRKYDSLHFPDVDNFFKIFFDTIKGVLIEDDRNIIGVKANTVRVSNFAKQGVSFTLISAYDLKIGEIVNIEEEADMDILSELRKKHSGDKIGQPWKHPMQMITTEQGIFFDTAVGKLWGVGRYGKEKQYDYNPEPGFDWNGNKKNDKSGKIADGTRGIIIFQRSGCWWINKWENK